MLYILSIWIRRAYTQIKPNGAVSLSRRKIHVEFSSVLRLSHNTHPYKTLQFNPTRASINAWCAIYIYIERQSAFLLFFHRIVNFSVEIHNKSIRSVLIQPREMLVEWFSFLSAFSHCLVGSVSSSTFGPLCSTSQATHRERRNQRIVVNRI